MSVLVEYLNTMARAQLETTEEGSPVVTVATIALHRVQLTAMPAPCFKHTMG